MLLHIETLCDAAIATSAEYFSGRDGDGSRIDPLVDPKQHECPSWNGSISVAAHDGRRADQGGSARAGSDAGDFGAVRRAQAIVIDRDGSPHFGAAAAPGGIDGMTRPQRPPMRLNRWQECWLYAIGLCVLLSGVGWLADHYLERAISTTLPQLPNHFGCASTAQRRWRR
jgi:hypothetical protein